LTGDQLARGWFGDFSAESTAAGPGHLNDAFLESRIKLRDD